MNIKDYFPDELRGKFIAKNQWAITEDFRYYSKTAGLVVVPAGFVTDGASIPSILWGIVGSPWSGNYPGAAVIHDYVYCKQEFKRVVCDKIFLEAMAVLGFNWGKRRLMYTALRMFGWLAWKKKRGKT